MSARHFPHLGCLATVIKPVWAWLLVLGCSTFHLTSYKWQPPGKPFGSHLAMVVSTCTATMHVCPTQNFYKRGAHHISGLTFGWL